MGEKEKKEMGWGSKLVDVAKIASYLRVGVTRT